MDKKGRAGRIGMIIRKMREKRGWTQDYLADKAGIKRSALGNYETGFRQPDLEVLEQLADAFEVTFGDFVNGYDLEPPEDEMWRARRDAQLEDQPDRRVLFDIARNGSASNVRQIRVFIDTMKATNPEFYDGDDPA